MIMKRVLLKSHRMDRDWPAQRRNLSQTVRKTEIKCCKIIIHTGSTDNLVSNEMVYKLNWEDPYIIAVS